MCECLALLHARVIKSSFCMLNFKKKKKKKMTLVNSAVYVFSLVYSRAVSLFSLNTQAERESVVASRNLPRSVYTSGVIS